MNALKSLKMNKHPKQKKWESKWNSCTRQRLGQDRVEKCRAGDFYFSRWIPELLPSFQFSSLCWAGGLNIKDRSENHQSRHHLFCHLCMCFLLLQSRISNHSLTSQTNVQKVFSLDLSLAQKGRNQRSLILHAFFLRAQQKTLLWSFPIFGGNLFFENFVIWQFSNIVKRHLIIFVTQTGL